LKNKIAENSTPQLQANIDPNIKTYRKIILKRKNFIMLTGHEAHST
jgi:hypothetical protein